MQPSDASLTIAWVHQHEVAHSWFTSMMATQALMMSQGRNVRSLAIRGGTGNLVEARNRAVTQFLDGDERWLFWIDTDMGFEPTLVDSLLEHADARERPAVGALAFAQKEVASDHRGGFTVFPCPTLYRWAEQPDGKTGFVSWHEYPRDQLVEVHGTGSACILIHRSVFEKIREKSGDVWYNRVTDPQGVQMSEDLSFCIRLAEVGVPLHVHTGLVTTHLKYQWLSQSDHDIALLAAEAAEAARKAAK